MTSDLPSGHTESHGNVFAVGVDLGGTTIKAGLVDECARVCARETRATPVRGGPNAVMDEIVSVIDALRERFGLRGSRGRSPLGSSLAYLGVGVGAPGPLRIRVGRVVRMANIPGWRDVPLRDELRARLKVPVSLDNDGNVAAWGEYWSRRTRRAVAGGIADSENDDLVMLTLGTGVGAGIVLDGRIVHGSFENAGELGHMIVAYDGDPCPCGQRGCLERYASASGVVRRVREEVKRGAPCVLRGAIEAGEKITASRVAQCARDGDQLCRRIWTQACTYLALACVNVQHALNPPRIVLGGGMSAAGPLLTEPVTERFRQLTWSLYDDRPAIEVTRLGADAGVIGAAGLVHRQS